MCGRSLIVETVLEIVKIVDFVAVLDVLVATVFFELKVAVHALPVESFFGTSAKLSQATLVNALVTGLFQLGLWYEGSRIKKVF
jgi:hypothetical protein